MQEWKEELLHMLLIEGLRLPVMKGKETLVWVLSILSEVVVIS